MKKQLLKIAVFVMGVLMSSGCEAPPDYTINTLNLRAVVMYDTAIFTSIDLFQVFVLKGESADGKTIGCADFPSQYQEGDTRLQVIAEVKEENRWKNAPAPAELKPISVPANENLVILIRGLSSTSQKGVATIARGCKDNLIFQGGTQNQAAIDIRSTTGMPCSQPNQCEKGLTCMTGTGFDGGYCAVAACTGDGECPQGARCVTNQGGGFCAQACLVDRDCNTMPPQSHSCEGRSGPTAGGCAKVCVRQNWSPSTKCQ